MDTITHALQARSSAKLSALETACFRRSDEPRTNHYLGIDARRIFPDSDVLRDIFSRNDLLMINWHRSLTHSLLMLPIFSLLLAALTQWIARKFQWDAPPFGTLTILYGIGILSHILL